ncbi:MAG: P27 family phage terminase small subunit [Oscillospiraceae bacterium]
MAKDGSQRGGARVNSGRKSSSLDTKIIREDKASALPAPAELHGVDMPSVKSYLKTKQQSGKKFRAKDVYIDTYNWLKNYGCEKIVSSQMIEQYAICVARWIACEEFISETGFLAKHPTTGAAIKSPYVDMSITYMKQANQVWYQIYQIVKENGSQNIVGTVSNDDTMEMLLVMGRKK